MFVQVSLSHKSNENTEEIFEYLYNTKINKQNKNNRKMLDFIKNEKKMYINLFCEKWLGKGALGVVLLLHGVNFC
jgi:hypothetical protein